ncbi:hypothetical protein OPV22_028280 [Ensete ventricosum]|uniref:Uncharacterized protein n=1 Tax=Ensete ventricosum TaxID=4639 RepID=A0AAV8PXS8_ENSVE|nr:hypothetical protein OPV22_028278 [Ensete ventricosum]KAJ8465728.1 hypothetical protein OPV22_028280 [Ensete ventricosum]
MIIEHTGVVSYIWSTVSTFSLTQTLATVVFILTSHCSWIICSIDRLVHLNDHGHRVHAAVAVPAAGFEQLAASHGGEGNGGRRVVAGAGRPVAGVSATRPGAAFGTFVLHPQP